MDGIDGLAASETIIVAGGLIIIGFLVALDAGALHTAAALAGAAAGFLRWNWYRAKLFLGDVGAIPIGFLLGFLLIRLALQGHLAAALILPGYFIADASLTLLRRVFEGKPFWRPHREHFFQRATLAHGNHARTVLTVLPVNIGLVMLAIAAIDHPLTASLAAIGVLAMLLLVLQLQARS
jgi:UDP-N-acetylmuramyl pentapeptide phosphotransferase/UDP-N-acetylglucosamine-1-phosphate transferase